MDTLIRDGMDFNANRRWLLGGWRDILEDIRQLCTGLNALPDGCACGNGRSHVGGSCACCHAGHRSRQPHCADCETVLAQLRDEFDTLAVDTIRFFPVVKLLLNAPPLELARAEGDSVERHVTAAVRTFERLASAVDDFHVGCRASHLRVVKAKATELLAEVRELDERLEARR